MSQNLQGGPQPIGPRPASAAPEQPSASVPTAPAPRGQAYSRPPGALEEAPRAASGKLPWQLVGLGVLAAAVLMGGIWYGVSGGSSAATPQVPAVDKQGETFSVAAVDADAKATALLKAILSGEANSQGAAGELKAINGAALAGLAKSAPQIAGDIKSGRRVLYRIYLLDFLAEDGDHVELSVDGASLGDIALKGAGTSFLIPLAPGTPATLKLLATADGGGGVTVGFISSLGEARTRVMQIGDFDQWQVVVQ